VLGHEALCARQMQPHLIGIGQVAEPRRRLGSLVDQEDGDHADLPRPAVRQRQTEEPGTDAQFQPAAGPRRRARSRHDQRHQPLVLGRDTERQRRLSRDAAPRQRGAARFAAAVEDLGRQRRLGHIVAPVQRGIDRGGGGIDHGRQADRAGKIAAARRRRVRLVMVAGGAAHTEPLRFQKAGVRLVVIGISG